MRQNFTEADLGENKARVIAERYSDVFGLETSYIPRFIEDAGQLEELLRPEVFRHYVYGSEPNTGRWVTNSELVILIGAVDNNKSRKLCHEVFLRARTWSTLTPGMENTPAKVVCGIRRAGKTVSQGLWGMLYPEVSTRKSLFPDGGLLCGGVGLRPADHRGKPDGRHCRGHYDLQHSGHRLQHRTADHLLYQIGEHPIFSKQPTRRKAA